MKRMLGSCGAVLALLAVVALGRAGAAPLGERRLVLASVKIVKCSNDAGKIVCPKGVTTIANEAAAWTKSFLSEASWACGPGKKEATGFELYWDYEDSAAHVGGDAGALEKLPPCVKDRLIPPLLEAVPPIHFKAKTSDPNVDVRYVLKVALTMQP